MVAGTWVFCGSIEKLLSVASDQVWPAIMWNPIIRIVDARVEVADARLVRVRLIPVGGLRRAEEVEFAVAGQLDGGVDVAFDHQRQAALALAPARLRRPADRVVGERNRAERRVDVRFHVVLAPQTFECEEPAGSDRDAFVAKLAFGTELRDWRPPLHRRQGRRRQGRDGFARHGVFVALRVEALLQAVEARLQFADFARRIGRIVRPRRGRSEGQQQAERRRREACSAQ